MIESYGVVEYVPLDPRQEVLFGVVLNDQKPFTRMRVDPEKGLKSINAPKDMLYAVQCALETSKKLFEGSVSYFHSTLDGWDASTRMDAQRAYLKSLVADWSSRTKLNNGDFRMRFSPEREGWLEFTDGGSEMVFWMTPYPTDPGAEEEQCDLYLELLNVENEVYRLPRRQLEP